LENVGGKPTKPVGSHLVLLQIDTLRPQQKELERKGVKDATTVGKKAHLRMKTVNKSSL